MQFRALAAAAIALASFGLVSADNGVLDVSYPRVCGNLCGPVVTVSQGVCLKDGPSCFCYQAHMKHLIPLCEACVSNARNTKNGPGFLPGIKKVQAACGFKTTSVTIGAAAPTAAPAMAGAAIAGIAALAIL